MWFKRKNTSPDEYRWYSDSTIGLKSSRRLLSEQKFLVVDTETTGLNIQTDQIVSIGIVPIQAFSICVKDTKEWILAHPNGSGSGSHIHEVIPSDQIRGIPEKEVAQSFLKAAQGAIIIGHHVNFDFEMLHKFLASTLQVELNNPYYDTGRMFKRLSGNAYSTLDHEPMSLALDKICKDLDIPIHDRHTALGDASATAILFMRLLKDLEKRGVKTVKDLLKR